MSDEIEPRRDARVAPRLLNPIELVQKPGLAIMTVIGAAIMAGSMILTLWVHQQGGDFGPMTVISALALYVLIYGVGSTALLRALTQAGTLASELANAQWAHQRAIAGILAKGARRPFDPESCVVTDREKESYTVALLSDLIDDRSNARYESSSELTRTCLQQFGKPLVDLEWAQRTALRLGIVGTFIGLAVSLGPVGSRLSQTGDLNQSASDTLDTLLAGLGVAFGTSIVGLLVSLGLSLVGLALREWERRYAKELDLAVRRLSQLVTLDQPRNAEELLREMLRRQQRIDEHVTDLVKHSNQLEQARESLTAYLQQVLDHHSEALREGLGNLETQRELLDEASTALDASRAGLANELAKASGNTAGVDLTVQRFEEVVDGLHKLARTFQPDHDITPTVMDALTEAMERDRTLGALRHTTAQRLDAIEQAARSLEISVEQLRGEVRALLSPSRHVDEPLRRGNRLR